MSRSLRARRGSSLALAALLLCTAGTAPAAWAEHGGPHESGIFPPVSGPPPDTKDPQRDTVTPAADPATTCQVYASSSGFGMLCSSAGTGLTLAAQAAAAGIDVTKRFCWDDPDLPDGFDPASQGAPPAGPGRWWLHTCLTFEGAVVRDNARLTYEYDFHRPGDEDELGPRERDFVTRAVGRGQIPYLQAQASPVSSPRVGQDVAFSLLCSPKVICRDTPQGRRIETPRIKVGGVIMHAEVVHLRVLPQGLRQFEEVVDCDFAGLPRTAQELDQGAADDPRVCRYRYERSSNGAGSGQSGDRYPALVTAYWQVFTDDGTGPKPFALAYAKTSTNLVRVTEVQTLNVS